MEHARARRSRTASALILVLAAIAFASLASSAAAAVRYVTPAGGGGDCTQALPCDISTGIGGAADGDQVVVGTGTYGSEATPVAISFPASGSISVLGAEIGPGRPVVNVSGTLTVTGANSLLSDLDLRSTSPQTLLVLAAGRADRVIATQSTATPTVNTCQIAGSAILSNSLCIRTNGDFSSAGLLMLDGAVARNVTVGSTGVGIFGNPSLTGTAANSIANAISTDIAFAGGAPAVPNDYFEDFTPATPAPTAPGRVSAGLTFRSPADFRQGPLSTTIDAGSAAETLGDLDLDGNLRVVGAAPDIGAYEDVPPPTVGIGAVVPEATTATLVPQVTTGGGRTTLTVDYGTTAGGPYTATTQQVVPADLAPSQPQVALSGLTPGTTYYYRPSVSSDGGAAAGAEGSFTTVSAPTATAGPATDVSSATATLTGSVDTMGGAAQAYFQYTPAGGAALTTPVQNIPAATGAQAVTAAVTGLAPSTAYEVALVVTNSAGTATSATSSFTTAAASTPLPPVLPPLATAGASSHVGLTGGIVTGTVDTRGLAGTVHFEVIPPDGGPAVTTADQPLPPGARQAGAAVSGLKPGTSYGVVVVATTAAGTARSEAGTLTTLRDTRAPAVRVRAPASLAIGRTTTLTPRVTCGEPCTVRAVARLGVRAGRRLAFRPLPNARITLRLTPVTRTAAADTDVHLNLARARTAALVAMGPGRRVVVRLQITATDAAGNRRTVVRFVGVRRR